jgi:gibberellin receptor GID1
VLISNFKLAYNMLRWADGTFDHDLAEFLNRRVPPDARALEGVSSSVGDRYPPGPLKE